MHLELLSMLDDLCNNTIRDVIKTQNTADFEPRSCMAKAMLQLLICGFARRSFDFNSIPTEIIKLMCHWATDGMTYTEVLNVLLHGKCCIGVYDYETKRWRTAIYIKHWNELKKIMVRYVCNLPLKRNEFVILNTFPTYAIEIYSSHYHTTYQTLNTQSHLPKQYLDEWSTKYKLTYK